MSSSKNKLYFRTLFFALSFSPLVLWCQDALIVQSTQVRQDPSATSQKIIDIAPKKSVKVLEKKGFWVKIEADGKSGWVKLSDIELPSISNNIDPLSTGRAANGNIVNTAGVRGLSPEELKGAKPNTAALEIAIKNSELIKDSDIASFISGGGLAPKSSTPQIKAVKTTLTGNTETTEASKNTSTSNKKTGKPTKENNDDKDW
jgi:hypothetical protein